ncbi:UvrD-helicase domain-containing protein [Meridianimaribacter flavus]|uniref:DNA 3'-5' helicase n=1 Tax=Meridianimaribacter flavus TaxID=571115 RepID=A0ABY2G6P2_9FLAO|nr:UvrD-helicase domain-containing protein [Meridianimaribacter flavus]TDY13477.1 ATP-dependent exoDNAse (exonuclease V) beta subunit [Meridianimaribacter flavus]
MLKNRAFTIYNASAGSGKTFTLVKEYLKILLNSNSLLAFRTVLALTFTNKAVNEMKERIINMLKAFSETSIIEHPNSMFSLLVEELDISPNELHEKSKVILQTIIHNYASFDISTIDKFNHRLIRTFAHDLKLPVNFEVELDTPYLLAKAVDKLIDKAGEDEQLTKVLVDFAIEKADDDRSWDISYDFNTIAKLLVNENDIEFIEQLESKQLKDFSDLKSVLIKTLKAKESSLVETSNKVLTLINEVGLEHNDFSRGYLPKYFQKLSSSDVNVSFNLGWQNDLLEGNTLYPKRVSNEVADTINAIQPQLILAFNDTKQAVSEYKFLNNCIKNITPLSVLNAINNTLNELKEEDNLLLISEFNSIIHKEIKHQPAPFIYERLGEKFKHYFIDEFQDTSVLQWQNLIPLADNVLSGENLKGETGSIMLVGDAKQAIYRWRGGKAEQFIDMYTEKVNPFHIEIATKHLDYNFRSTKTVVDFNNDFFKHISSFALSSPEHQAIYQASSQDVFIQENGYVELSFLNTKDQDKDELHCEKTLFSIYKALDNGFKLGDICVITRKSKEGIAIAEYLSQNGINVVSSESLMLKNAPEVNFITSILQLSIQPQNNEVKCDILLFIAEHSLKLEQKHDFVSSLVHLPSSKLFTALKEYGFNFHFGTFSSLPIYEAVEHIIRAFKLNTTSNAYIQFYLDEILDFSQKHGSSISSFLEFWERKKDKLSIVSSQNDNAVQIMTIHKSKGLEFPVVIFPYANQNIYFDMSPKVWFPVNTEAFNGFSHMYINLNKDLEELDNTGNEIYTNYQSELELDAINLLYVVMTRAVEQLYVISEYDTDAKNEEKLKYYSGLFINFLKSKALWNDTETEYTFGNPKRTLQSHEAEPTVQQELFISTSRAQHNLNIITNSAYLWDTDQEKSIEKGNLVHNIMAEIKTKEDIDFVFNQYIESGTINSQQYDELKPMVLKIVDHQLLKPYFESDNLIYNERDIITKDGQILRPDRLVINTNKAIIIDYKTGAEKSSHKQQLELYTSVLQDMNYNVTKKILVYINDDIQVKEF